MFVEDLGPTWRDEKIWEYATANRLTIVTRDADFSVRVFVRPGGPHVIHLRVGNMKIRALHQFLVQNWPAIAKFSREHQLVTVFEDHVDCVT